MKYRTRTYYTGAQKALMWERWKQGWTLHQIAHLFDRAHGSIRGIFERTGGFRAPQRSRSLIALTLAEREEISRSVAEGQSIRSTAARLGRAASSQRSRPRRLGPRAASQVLQTSQEQSPGADRDRKASAAVVARTDRRMAQACSSARREPSRVARDPSASRRGSRTVRC